MEAKTMKEKKRNLSKWFFGMAFLIVLGGALTSAFLIKNSEISSYPGLIKEAYREPQHHLVVPGSIDVKLTRTGAYGIYYEDSLGSVRVDPIENLLPAIDCSLSSKSTGIKIVAAPDYVETNRYWSKDKVSSGVLIMSVTVDHPGTYTFACKYKDNNIEPEIRVALGPNYFWEFFSVAWNVGLPLLGGLSILCGVVFLGLIFLGIGIVLKLVVIAQN
jgi:hypothetical protein